MLPSATPAFFAISGVVVPWYPCVVKSSSAARTRRWCVRSAWLIGRESNVPAGTAPGFLPVPPLTSFPAARRRRRRRRLVRNANAGRSEEHTSELQSQSNLVCRLLLEKKKKKHNKCLLDQFKRQTESTD